MGLFKRGGVWWMRFSYQGQQVRQSCETGDKRLAEKIYHKVMTEVAEDKWFERLPGEDKTFVELMEKYISEYNPQPISYCQSLVNFFGDFTLKKITPSLINEFKQLRKSRDGVKPATLNRQTTIAKRAFNIAIKEWEWIKDNPFSRVSKEKGEGKRDRWLSFKEEERLLPVCPKWLADYVIFAAWTGIREGNIITLKDTQIDMFSRVIRLGGEGNQRTKNNEPYTVPMNSKVYNLLKEKLKVNRLNGLVFVSSQGYRLSPRNIRRDFYKACEKAGIENFKPHDLRHTYGTRLAQSGIDLYTISKLLGHKDIRTTQRYAHHCTQSLRRGVDAFEQEISTILAQSGKVGRVA